jgi:UDP-glucose-4-epimerase GalE
MTRILVTGGAGYIGSHTAKLLSRYGIETAVFDNLSRGHRDFVKWSPLIEADLRNTGLLRDALHSFKPDVVLHFAAFAYVGESFGNPGIYYDNNVGGTVSLLRAMQEAGVGKAVVSSSCAVYGQPDHMPITENTPRRPINPYGMTKLMMEQICGDFETAHGLRWVALRYFNACGCDPDGEIGERHDPEPHLIPRLFMAQNGEIEALDIMGDDYPTADGTCIRDYVHVNDLAEAHIKAARYLLEGGQSEAFNLGTGHGVSVRKVIETAAKVTGKAVPHRVAPRRDGDPAILVADAAKARRTLGWSAEISDMTTILETAWTWHKKERRQ